MPVDFVEELRGRLRERPGSTFQLPGFGLREAAVLAPLVVRGDEPALLFTRRPDSLRTHAGQISFPGGARDPGDVTPLHTALRELEEELAVPRGAVDVLGQLDEMPTISRFRVRPFVGVVSAGATLQPNPVEVAELIEVPLRVLLDPARLRTARHRVPALARLGDVYFYDDGPHVIWGATARMVKNLLEVARGLPAFEALSR